MDGPGHSLCDPDVRADWGRSFLLVSTGKAVGQRQIIGRIGRIGAGANPKGSPIPLRESINNSQGIQNRARPQLVVSSRKTCFNGLQIRSSAVNALKKRGVWVCVQITKLVDKTCSMEQRPIS